MSCSQLDLTEEELEIIISSFAASHQDIVEFTTGMLSFLNSMEEQTRRAIHPGNAMRKIIEIIYEVSDSAHWNALTLETEGDLHNNFLFVELEKGIK